VTLLGTAVLVVLPVVGDSPANVAAAASDPVLVVAGDISCGVTDPNFNGSDTSGCQQRATASLIASIAPNYLLPGGDTQYTANPTEGGQPTTADYTGGYDATDSWGGLQNPSSSNYVPGLVVRPTPGDNEYGDNNENDRGSVSNASNYFANFGPSDLNDLPAGVTDPATDFYSFNIPVDGGTWHIISLDSECAALPAFTGGPPSQGASGCAAGSPEETFLKNDLAANQGVCTLIHWHEPEFHEGDAGPTPDTDYQAFWNDAYQYHVTMIVNGHDHDYERWQPLNTSGNPDPNGVDQIIAGTGGNSHSSKEYPSSDVVSDDFSHFGVLELTLHAGSADFAFKTVNGTTPDSGTIDCTPTVAGVSSSVGPLSGGNTVTVTGTNFTGTPRVHFGSTPATNVTVTSATTLTATAPAGSGTVGVTVTNSAPTGVSGSGPTSPTSSSDLYTYAPAPTVTGVSPNVGPSVGGTSVTVTGTSLTGATAVDFGSTPGTNVTVTSDSTLTVNAPAGTRGTVDITVTTPSGTSTTGPPDQFTYQNSGYWMVGSDGSVFSFGGAPYEGSLPGLGVRASNIVSMVPTADGKGYWMIGSDGGVFAFGDAGFVGSLPGIHVHVTDIVGAVPTQDGKGYWMIGSDGGVFAFGDAGFVGSLPGLHVHVSNIVAAVPTADGKGYWMIGSDGGVFAFGDAGFVGSLPGIHVHVDNIVGAVPTSSGKGYWMVGSDGGVFAFGDAGFVGSLPGLHIHVGNVVGVVATQDNKGYWMVGSDGGVFAFGDAGFVGSVPSLGIKVSNIVAFARQ